MKIRLVPENKVYAGSPSDIVRKLAEDAIFLHPATPEEYLDKVSRRLPSLMIEGNNFDERCESFINGLVQIGAAKIVTGNPKP